MYAACVLAFLCTLYRTFCVLSPLGPTVEFVVMNVATCVLFVALRQLPNNWLAYITAGMVGATKAPFFTVPFILTTKLCCGTSNGQVQVRERSFRNIF